MAAARIPNEIREVLERQRRRIERLARGHTGRALMEILQRARADLLVRLHGIASGRVTYTLHQHRLFLLQIEQAMLELSSRLRGHLDKATESALRQSVHDVIEQVSAWTAEYRLAEVSLPLQEALGLVLGDSKLREVEERRIEQGAARYGRDGVAMMERELSQSLLMGETVDQATRRVTGRQMMLDRYWKAERLVRTEFAHAYNAGARTALDEVAKMDDHLWLMWDEHAEGPMWGGPDDIPWPGPARPLDDRTAPDSLRLHGQLRRPGQMFIDPLTGRQYPFPPNRPNDRATLTLIRLPARSRGGREPKAPAQKT